MASNRDFISLFPRSRYHRYSNTQLKNLEAELIGRVLCLEGTIKNVQQNSLVLHLSEVLPLQFSDDYDDVNLTIGISQREVFDQSKYRVGLRVEVEVRLVWIDLIGIKNFASPIPMSVTLQSIQPVIIKPVSPPPAPYWDYEKEHDLIRKEKEHERNRILFFLFIIVTMVLLAFLLDLTNDYLEANNL